jgi:hypothetical protein
MVFYVSIFVVNLGETPRRVLDSNLGETPITPRRVLDSNLGATPITPRRVLDSNLGATPVLDLNWMGSFICRELAQISQTTQNDPMR